MKIFKSVVVTSCLVFSSLFLLACGGGGGGGGEDDSPTVLSGVFLDSAVEGLSYSSGEQSGVTNAMGAFNYEEGALVTFKVGDIVIGTARAQAVMTPLSLVDGAVDVTDVTVTNIVRFLMTIDEDDNATNGIQINANVNNAAILQSIDFTLGSAGFEGDANVLNVVALLTPLTSSGARVMVTEFAAQSHFLATLNDIDGGSSSTTNDNPGTLMFSGGDATAVGVTFNPFGGGVAISETTFVDFPGMIWFDYIPKGNISVGYLTVTVDEVFLYFVPADDNVGFTTKTYAYNLVCAEVAGCSNIGLNVEAHTMTFNNVVLPVSTDTGGLTNLATDSLTLNGTLNWTVLGN